VLGAHECLPEGVVVGINGVSDYRFIFVSCYVVTEVVMARSPEYISLPTRCSAESGDDGEVGRGNRTNGLITPNRPMNLEVAAGKIPVTHIGKLCNVVAQHITNALVWELPEVEEACWHLVNSIGSSVQEPQVADLHVRLTEGVSLTAVHASIREIFHAQLSQRNPIDKGL